MTSHERHQALNSIQSEMENFFLGSIILGLISSCVGLFLNPLALRNTTVSIVAFLVVLIIGINWLLYDRIVRRKSTGWAATNFWIQLIGTALGFTSWQPGEILINLIMLPITVMGYNLWRLAKDAKRLKRERIEDLKPQPMHTQAEPQTRDTYVQPTNSVPLKERQPKVMFFNGERNLENDAYQIYLSEKHEAKLNPLLGKYQFDSKLFSTVSELLVHMHELDLRIEEKVMRQPDNNRTEIDYSTQEWTYKARMGLPAGPESLGFLISLKQNDYFYVRKASDENGDYLPLLAVLLGNIDYEKADWSYLKNSVLMSFFSLNHLVASELSDDVEIVHAATAKPNLGKMKLGIIRANGYGIGNIEHF